MTTMSVRIWSTAAVSAALLAGANAPALAGELSYRGQVVGIDSTHSTFTVESSARHGAEDMVFRLGPDSQVFVGGEHAMAGELATGDRVVVSYSPGGTTDRADRVRIAARELTFRGAVIATDPDAQTFTVKKTARGGKVEEMTFHANLPVRAYWNGEAVPLQKIHNGDLVTVTYEAKHVWH